MTTWNSQNGKPLLSDGKGIEARALLPEKSQTAEAIQSWLIARLSERLGVAASEIDISEPFISYGLTSREAVVLSGELRDWLGFELSETLLWEYPSIEAVADHLAIKPLVRESTVKVNEGDALTTEPIAIIGVACRFPAADDTRAFWQLLQNGVDAISEVPEDRWDVNAFYDPTPTARGKLITRYGGFLGHAYQFDPQFFGISPREATRMDPQHRLLLEVAWEALEDAGQAPDRLAGSRTGVFIGISTSDYARLLLRDPDSIDIYAATGSALSLAANRLSYLLDLRGPSMALDTACSSSLVSVHLACQSLRSGESKLALAGGVNMILSPELSIALSQAQMLSTDGRCRTFDADATGYVRGEGCGIVVLKRLSDALKNGDHIRALIRGSAINQDGRSNGLTAPNGPAQQAVIRSALGDAGVSPSQISYVETHGTGTPLGDPIEARALAAVMQEGRAEDKPCVVGSVKTNIGHLESAAGIAGLIKVVLSLEHKEIPPHLHLKALNPHINFEELPLLISTERRAWPTGDERRFAGISAFSFGGTNTHVVLEEAPASVPVESRGERPLHLLTLSAKNENALRTLAGRYVNHLVSQPEQQLADVCFTANTGRSQFPYRLAVTVSSREQLGEQLHSFAVGENAVGLSQGHSRGRTQPKIAFLFTGQGSQYPGMGHELYLTQPSFRETLEECDALLRSELERPLLSVLYPQPDEPSLLDETAYAQPALFALEYALAKLWRSWGIEPDAVLGHSVGEYVAACVAGVFSLEDGLKLCAERGRLMQSLRQKGQMAVVLAGQDRVAAALAASREPVSIAAHNGPDNTVISGAPGAVRKVRDELESEGITTRSLNVSHAFHSSLMEPMLDAFEQKARQIHFEAPRIPLISNLTGRKAEGVFTADYWRRHIRETVRFADGVNALTEEGIEIFVELGPDPILLGMSRRCLPKASGPGLMPTLKQGQHDWQVLADSLGALYSRGVNVNWEGFDRDYQRRRVSLPTYPFERQLFRISAPGPVDGREKIFHQEAVRAGSNGRVSAPPEQRSNFMTKETEILMSEAKGDIISKSTRKDSILLILTTIVSDLLQMDSTAIGVDLPFLEMGADSLILIDAIRRIESTFEVKLSIRQLFEEFSTIEALAAHLDQALAPDWGSPHRTSQQIKPNVPLSTASGDLPVQLLPAEPSTHISPEREERAAGHESGVERVLVKQLDVLSRAISQQMQFLQSNDVRIDSAPSLKRVPSAVSTRTAKSADAGASYQAKASAIILPLLAPDNSALPNTEKAFTPFEGIRPGPVGGLSLRQQRHLESLTQRYTERTQKSKQLAQRYRPVLADNRASAGFRFSIKEMLYPITAERSLGSKIWDVDGNQYIDLTMGFGVNLFGHEPSFVMESLAEQLKLGIQLGPQSKLAGEVAELISELTGMERITFCNSGTEAVMTALRLARTATKRTRIALFAGSYHGTFDGVLARAQIKDEHLRSIPIAPGIPPHMVEDVLVLDYGSPQSLEILQTHAHELAAVLVEPVQSRRPALQPKEFLQELRRLTSAAGAILIFDEVITGFRVHAGGAQAWFGIKADLAAYGKIVGGGMPIGVVAGKAALMDGIDGGMWAYGDASHPQAETTFFAGTFCKHPLAMAAALAILKRLKMEGATLHHQLNQRTARLAETLNAYFEQQSVAIEIVHFGSLFRFAFTGNLDLLFYHLYEKGIYIWEGRNCFLSTAHTDEDVDVVIQAVKESVAEMREGDFLPAQPSRSTVGDEHALPINPLPLSPATLTPVSVASEAHASGDEEIKAETERTVPLTEAQKQLWVLTHMGKGGSLAYNESIILDLRGPFRYEAMCEAAQKMIERHEALRTIISSDGEFQTILPTLKIDIPLTDFAKLAPSQRDAETSRWLREESQQVFDLTRGPLLRIHIIKLDEQRHLLVLTAHHIVVDGWSLGIFLADVSALYSAACQDVVCQLRPAMQFREYIKWQEQLNRSGKTAADESYWLNQLVGPLPVMELPTDSPRPPVKGYQGARQSKVIDTSLYRDLKQLSGRQGCTIFMTMLAVYIVLLQRLTSQEDLIVGFPVSGRPPVGGETLIGYCANLLPIRSGVTGNPVFTEYLHSIRSLLLDAYEHQEYPFASLINKLNPLRDVSRAPLLVTFNMDRRLAPPEMFELEVKLVSPPISHAKFDLSVNIVELDDALQVEFDYNTELFDESTIERLVVYFQTLLEVIVTAPDQHLSDLRLMTAAQRHQITVEWNDTQSDYPADRCVHQLFEAQAELTPDAVAVVFEDQQVTYRELNIRANQLAHYLRSLGVRPEGRVGICVERSIEMIVGLLGIFKANGAYVPLDPTYPKKRLDFIIGDSQPQVLVTQARLLDNLPPHDVEVVCLDSDWKTIASESEENLTNAVCAQNLAYVMYTSGSTGKPKGVLVEHQGICNLAVAQARAFNTRPDSRVLQFASFAFDASVSEIFVTLLAGATLYIGTPDCLMLGAPLIELLRWQDISSVTLPASVLEVLPPEAFSALETIISAGEDCSASVVARWAPGRRFLNAYGPTEATVCATIAQCSDNGRPPPIGRPIANTQVYLLDRHLQPVPLGLPGELFIGGVGLARGYMHRPGLTAQMFIPHPFSTAPGARLYRTGDLARHLPDGQIEFLGRRDQQLKIRGYRIELEEIEAVLRESAAVSEAVVLGREEQSGAKRLVAYVVREAGMQGVTGGEVRAFLREKLPDYMVPGVVIFLDSLPLTPNGKVDRQALPGPEATGSEMTAFVAPRDMLELQLTRIWEELLGVPRIGVTDNFFELGGHSFLALRLMAQIHHRFEQNLPLSTLFRKGTIEHLASLLRQKPGSIQWSPLVEIQPHGSELPFFCAHPGGGNVLGYFSLARHLGTEHPFYGLQAPGLDGEQEPLTSIEEMATLYVEVMRVVQPTGPYRLGGHSFGGFVAFEMALQLQKQGHEVALLAILDTVAPVPESKSLHAEMDDVGWMIMIAKVIERFLGKEIPVSYDELQRLEPDEQLNFFLAQLRMVNFVPEDTAPSTVRALLKVYQANDRAVQSYAPQEIYLGPITLFRSSEKSPEDFSEHEILRQDPALHWGQFSSLPVQVINVPGDHITMLTEPHVQVFADNLRACLDIP